MSPEAPPCEHLSCRLEERVELTRELHLLRFSLPHPLHAQPGQFAMLRLEKRSLHPFLGRPMSILDAGEELRFLIRRCGGGTQALTSIEPGERVQVLGPVGVGWGAPQLDQELILVAGGVGVAPLLFAAGEHVGATFLYGARSASELVLLDEIRQVSRLELATDDGTAGHEGPVTELLERRLARGGLSEIWTCGPEGMMEAVAKLAFAYGASCKVSVEARMACGRGLCLGCARLDAAGEPRYVCLEGPVFDFEQLYTPRGEAHG